MSTPDTSSNYTSQDVLTVSPDPYKRVATQTPGITYRERRDGTRKYSVRHGSSWVPVHGGLAEARAVKADLDLRKAKGQRVVVPPKKTFGEANAEWFEFAKRKLRPGTVKDYQNVIDKYLIPRFGTMRLAAIDAETIVLFIQDLQDGKLSEKKISESRIANICKPLSATLGYAVFRGWVASNAWRIIPDACKPSTSVTREHRSWSTEDVQKVIDAAYSLGSRKDARYDYAPLIEFMLWSGARLGEALGACWKDVEWDTATFTVQRQWTRDNAVAVPKTEAGKREIPLAPEIVASLRKHLRAQMGRGLAGADAFIFAGRNGNPPTHSNFRRRGWTEVIEKAGLAGGVKLTPHDTRHGFASILGDRGVSSHIAARVMGHTTAAVTEGIYSHSFNKKDQDRQVREALSTAISGVS